MKSTNRTPLVSGKSRQRLRTERKALDFLDTKLDLPPLRRRKARDRIRSAKQPGREAQRIILETLHGGGDTPVDFSDVQEVRVKLIRRDHYLCPEQINWLDRLERQIAEGGLSRSAFDREATELLAMPNSFSHSFRLEQNKYIQEFA